MIDILNSVRIRVAGLVMRDGEVLLISHRKDGRVYWLLPGGGVDHGESLEEALQREFLEELGISVRVGQPVLICDSIDPEGRRHIVNIVFSCTHTGGEYSLGAEERLYGYRFCGPGEISALTMYPPINRELVALARNEKTDLYVGRIWLNQ